MQGGGVILPYLSGLFLLVDRWEDVWKELRGSFAEVRE